MGANNSIIFILVFVLYSLFLREVSLLVRKRETLAKPKISNKSAYKSNYYAGTIIRYISNVLMVCSFAAAVFNTVYPVVDMSLPYDFLFWVSRYCILVLSKYYDNKRISKRGAFVSTKNSN